MLKAEENKEKLKWSLVDVTTETQKMFFKEGEENPISLEEAILRLLNRE